MTQPNFFWHSFEDMCVSAFVADAIFLALQQQGE